jgi:hypothetical protein
VSWPKKGGVEAGLCLCWPWEGRSGEGLYCGRLGKENVWWPSVCGDEEKRCWAWERKIKARGAVTFCFWPRGGDRLV